MRTRVAGAWRVYRPAIVVGDSRTGEMDKIDGPYYFFKAIQKARDALPQWFPLVGLEVGWTNIVPVDCVAAAMDHIAHEPGLDGQAFHLVNPRPQRVGDVLNTFARAAHAPQMALRVDKRMTDMLPKGVLSYAMKLPALKDVRRTLLADLGIPEERDRAHGAGAAASTRATPSARCRAPASRCRRSRATPRSCGTTGSATSTRTCTRTARSRAPSTARRS